jgi:hypothetical protein
MMINPYFYFIQSTIGMLLERSSHHDDESADAVERLKIDDVYCDQMDEYGNIYDAIIQDECDAENAKELGLMFGNKADLESYFDSVMAMLKDYGYIAQFYEDHKRLTLDECLVVAESLHSLIR